MINLDEVRPLDFAVDKVDVSNSVVALDAASLAALEVVTVNDGGGSITVDGTVELGATTLAALETIELGATTLAALENVVVSGEVELGATTLAALENVVVSATDLDIRNLVFATDKVDVSNSVVALDAATLAALETVTIVEGAYQSWKSTAASATSIASQLVATPLTARLNITIQNLGSSDVFIGASDAVTIATGTKIAKFSSFSEKLGASAPIWAITASGTADLRISEFAN